eukprot:4519840-Amphidinium_carterae.1
MPNTDCRNGTSITRPQATKCVINNFTLTVSSLNRTSERTLEDNFEKHSKDESKNGGKHLGLNGKSET